jgi:small conductance mechanosensitive channel
MDTQQRQDTAERTRAKKSAIRWMLILAGILAAVLAVTTYVVQPFIAKQYLLYLQVAEVAVVGYFIIHILSVIFYKLALVHSALTANSIKSLVRIAGAIIVIAFIISYLARDPVLAASLTTISGLVIGFASSNLIGNVIAGLYLAISRPFKIGDRIKVFGETGTVIDISLLYTRLILHQSQNEMLASNSSMVTTQVILIKDSTGLKHMTPHERE